MFCRKCYSPLDPDIPACPKCAQAFDPQKPRTYLQRPFPGARQIIRHIVRTTFFGVVAACAVAVFQMVQSSGH